MKVEIMLPLEKETKGALLYRDQALAERNPLYIADGIYVRKAGVRAAQEPGQTSWPKAIKLTIEEVK